MNRYMLSILFMSIALTTAAATSLQDIKMRMQKRVDEIARLKKEQVVGVNRGGLLEIVVPDNAGKDVQELVEAENRDRQLIYKYIAAKTGTTVEKVGRQRAKMIYERAAAGVMLKGSDGAWYEKGS